MQGSMWKLATCVAILGVGGLVVMQVQRTLNDSNENEKLSLEEFTGNMFHSPKTANAAEEPGTELKINKLVSENEKKADSLSGNPFALGENENKENTEPNVVDNEIHDNWGAAPTKDKIIVPDSFVSDNKEPVVQPFSSDADPFATTKQKVVNSQPVRLIRSAEKDLNEKTDAAIVKTGALFEKADEKLTQVKKDVKAVEKSIDPFSSSADPFSSEPIKKEVQTKIKKTADNLKMVADEKVKIPGFFPAAENSNPLPKKEAVQNLFEPESKPNPVPKPKVMFSQLVEPKVMKTNDSQPLNANPFANQVKPTAGSNSGFPPANPTPENIEVKPQPTVISFQNDSEPKELKSGTPFDVTPMKEIKTPDVEVTAQPIFKEQPTIIKSLDTPSIKVPGTSDLTPVIVEKEDDELIGDAVMRKDAPQGVQKPELKLEKLAPETAVLGQAMVYQIIIRNTGQVPAHQVVIEDQIPKGTKLSGTIPRAQLKDKKLIWRLGTFAPGDEKKIKVKVIPVDEGDIGSITTVNFVAEVAATTRITSPKLALNVTSPEQSVVGEDVSFIYRIMNTGEGDATGVVLRSLLPDELSHTQGNDLEYEVGLVPAGESREVRLTMKAISPGDPKNNAMIEANGGITAKTSSDLNIIKSVLNLTRKGPGRRFVGRDAIYTMKVKNNSIRTLRNVRITESVPSGLKYLGTSPRGQYDTSSRLIGWTIPQIPAGQEVELKVTLNAKMVGNQKSVVDVADEDGHQATLTANTKVEGFASLAIHEIKGKGSVAVGERVSWKFHLKNRGSAKATNVTLACKLPTNIEFVDAKGPSQFKVQGQLVTFDPIQSLQPGQETTVDIVMTAINQGNTRLDFSVNADQMQDPITHQEAVIVYDESQ